MKLNNNDDSHNSGLNLLIYNMLLDIESHPAWVCGLKLLIFAAKMVIAPVTPCVGVWIETVYRTCLFRGSSKSHPAWVCGLKLTANTYRLCSTVTPCVGVWIETGTIQRYIQCIRVTPCVGVWIETSKSPEAEVSAWSHPAWVCGLKP